MVVSSLLVVLRIVRSVDVVWILKAHLSMTPSMTLRRNRVAPGTKFYNGRGFDQNESNTGWPAERHTGRHFQFLACVATKPKKNAVTTYGNRASLQLRTP
jgi:hypothetical protein